MPAPLASYVAEFELCMRKSARIRNNKEAEDLRQDMRLALWELRDMPATRDEALQVFARLAARFESRAKRQVFRQGALVEEPEEFAGAIERDAERSLALFDALEKLTPYERWLVKECKIEDRSYAEVGKQLGVTDNTVRNHLWRAMTKLIAFFKEEEKRLEEDEAKQRAKDKKSSTIVAPLAFEFTDTQRAMFSAIWRAEGRVPTFGEGPPGQPPVIPGSPPVFAAPAIFVAAGAAVAVVVLALLLGVPATIATSSPWGNSPQMAHKGLRLPPITVIDDVVPMDYVPPPRNTAQTPVASSSVTVQAPTPPAPSPTTAVASSAAPSSSPSIDPVELERARRHRPPRFLPSR